MFDVEDDVLAVRTKKVLDTYMDKILIWILMC